MISGTESSAMKHCYQCGELIVSDYISVRATCPNCGADLHVCLNCVFHDPMSYNECREPQSEMVSDRDRNNFCDYYRFKTERRENTPPNETELAKAKLEALFKNGS